MKKNRLSLACAACLIVPTLVAQELLLDINTSSIEVPTSEPRSLETIGGFTYFSAASGALGLGRELWRTDGTEAGTTLVADIWPGGSSSDPADFTDMGDGTILFTAESPGLGRELWRTDGTAAGTWLVADIAPDFETSAPQDLTLFEGLVYFFADDADTGYEPWVSDGTTAGTVQLANFASSFFQGHVGTITASENEIYIATDRTSDPTNGFTLYSSTNGANDPLLDLVTTPQPQPDDVFITFGDLLFFDLDGGPWISDGSVDGTLLLKNAELTGSAVATDDAIYFAASQPATGVELWMSDGTPLGTQRVTDLSPGPASGLPDDASIVVTDSGTIVFGGIRPDVGHELFAFDGTQVVLLNDIAPGTPGSQAKPITTLGSSVLFRAQASGILDDVFATSDTPGPIEALLPLPAFKSIDVTDFAVNGSQLIMAAGAESNTHLWRSDLTAAGTTIVADIVPPQTLGSDPTPVVTVGDLGFFFAQNSAVGRELFITDGTTGGTQLVADVNPGMAGSVIGTPVLAPLGNGIVFIADGLERTTPYFSDGTLAGTYPLADGHADITTSEVTVLGEHAFFFHADDVAGTQLWKSDGTPEGTALFFDFTPGAASVEPGTLTTIGNAIYMTPLVGLYGRELWISDGTAPGTQLVADIRPGPQSSSPSGMTAIGDRVVFAAKEAVAGREVWVTDGTTAGTSLAIDIRPGPDDSTPRDFITVGDTMMFNARPNGGETFTYSTDVSVSNPSVIFEFPNVAADPIFPFGDGFAFSSRGLDGPDGLWLTDGTPAGTVLAVPETVVKVVEIRGQPGTDARLLFTGLVEGESGSDLVVTDGTVAGTFILEPDIGSAVAVESVSRLGNQLLIAKDSAVFGTELFTLPLENSGAHVATTFGAGCEGSTGVPAITTSGAPADGELLTIGLENAQPNALTYLVVSTTSGPLAADGCALLPIPPILIPLATDGAGAAGVTFTADASFVGLRLVTQWATFDPAGDFLGKASLTAGLELVFGP